MHKSMLLLAFSFLLALAPAGATVINFDDLSAVTVTSNAANWGIVPSTYDGYNWNGWEVVNGPSFQSVYNTSLTFPSMPNAAYNGGDGNATVTMSAVNPFNLAGAYFSFWPGVPAQYQASSITVTGTLGANPVGSTVVNLGSQAGFNWVSLNLNGVDSVSFSSGPGKYWLVDNIDASAVPEPTTYFMISAGLGLLFVGRLRRRKATA